MASVTISYYSDVLCIWAYGAHRRIEQLVQKYGDELEIEPHFCSVFPDAWSKISTQWRERGGFEGFNRHINDVAQKLPHIVVDKHLWLKTRPRTSASAHLFLKAIEIIEQEMVGDNNNRPQYLERMSTRATWEVRNAFFALGRDISDWRVHAEIAEHLDIDYGAVNERIQSSEAVAQLAADYDLSQKNRIEGSPTFVMNDGRQRLFGNVGYRLIEANVKELLNGRAADEASWH